MSMKDRIAESMGPEGVSMVPAPKEEKLPSAKTPPEIEALVGDANDVETIKNLVYQYYSAGEVIKELEAKRKITGDRLKSLLGDYGIKGLMAEDHRVALYETKRSTIKAEKLLAHGVSVQIITDCTEVSTSESLRVTKEKGSA